MFIFAVLLIGAASATPYSTAAALARFCRSCSPYDPKTPHADQPLEGGPYSHLAQRAVVLTEGFEVAPPPTWVVEARSEPPGLDAVFQGRPDVFPAQSGPNNSYAGMSFNNVDANATNGTISTWLITPVVPLMAGTTIVFWTRTVTNRTFADRLQVRVSFNGASTDVGNTAFSVGDFSTLLLDIDPNYVATDYPNEWTQYIVTIPPSGPVAPIMGRVAFRYFVENGGASGTNSDYIGVDTVVINTPDAVPEGTE